MVQEIKNITDIYLSLFKTNKEPIYKFINKDFFEENTIQEYEENLRVLKLISEQVDTIFQANSFFNLPSVALLAGKPKLLTKIDNNINANFYELINYINNIELLLYENSNDLNFKFKFNIDLLSINNYLYKSNSNEIYDNIFNNINPKKFIIFEGIDNYFFKKINYFLSSNQWKIFYLNKNKFDFIVLKNNIIN